MTQDNFFFIVNVTSLPISKSVMGKFMTMYTLSQSGADQRNKARQFVIAYKVHVHRPGGLS